MRSRSMLALLVASLPATACVDPLTDDAVPARDTYEPDEEGANPPWVSGALAETIRRLDAIDDESGIARRLSGFVDGRRVWFWDFGATVDFVAPLWELVQRNEAGELERVTAQGLIWDVVPGDPGYSPFWEVYLAEVTDLYHGQVLTSRQAVDDAVRDGIILEPVPSGLYANCPVVDEQTYLEVAGHPAGAEPCPEDESRSCKAPKWAFYRGRKVGYFDTNGPLAFDHEAGLPPHGTVYRLQREDEALPISEPARQVDITGDGDVVDTNDVFDSPLDEGDHAYTPVRRQVDVFVSSEYSSIDTAGRERAAEYRSAEQLEGDAVRGIRPTDQLFNLPLEANDCTPVADDDCASCERTLCCAELFGCLNDDGCFLANQALATCLGDESEDPQLCWDDFEASGAPAAGRLECRTGTCSAECPAP